MLVYFDVKDNGYNQRVFGKYNKNTQEITLPSGYTLPVIDGYVYYIGQQARVYDVNGKEVK